ncbi:hypothetical protein ASPCADRAFT_202689 [Aspergillus carbonarius ITEM 5010]|uniref:Uncharacterized protein n=1 Tax=Aspergillus carbonarius (strain ITEM 5010) TaxID=602072 RepID=A0A1R3S278_ASPC5|nr:hypothetical protein ASPCADRAFT_202689 [Aspergillus carbonarius ITEM 5010]
MPGWLPPHRRFLPHCPLSIFLFRSPLLPSFPLALSYFDTPLPLLSYPYPYPDPLSNVYRRVIGAYFRPSTSGPSVH